MKLHELCSAFSPLLATILVGCGSGANDPRDSADATVASALPEAALSVADVVDGGQSAPEASGIHEAGSVEVSLDANDAAPIVEVDALDGGDGAASCSPYITKVIRVDYGPGAGFGQTAFPRVVVGPPSGLGCCMGSLNVLSLGEGGSIVVEFGQAIIDGPGPDFIVFENAFNVGANPQNPFAEPGTVEVSADGVTWTGFPCTASAYPYGSCAGWHPVLANPASNQIDPLDPAVAGGDAFDLADLPGDAGISEARYVRITDRADLSGDFDLDAVAVVNGRCR